MKEELLTRDDFRNGVFARDGHKCVICGEPAQDAHHILERRLWGDSGYYLGNGASLCGKHHIEAEQTVLTCDEIRIAIGVDKPLLPEHLYRDNVYDKWGNIILPNGWRTKGELFHDPSVQKILTEGNVLQFFVPYVKYPRTYHLPWSEGLTNDDRMMEDVSVFVGKEVVVTIKKDGENFSGSSDGYAHARSLDSGSHVSRNYAKSIFGKVFYELPEGWRICGENLYAKHSIGYKNLDSYLMVFSIWNEKNQCLSWDDTVEWCELLGLKTVQMIYRGIWDEERIRGLWNEIRNGYDGEEAEEGYVVRIADGFNYGEFRRCVGKFVRKNHVQSDQHWIHKPVEVNGLKEQT